MDKALQHPTILGLIALAAAIYGIEVTSGADFGADFGLVPAEIIQAGKAAIGGNASTSTLSKLITSITSLFLHGSPQHLLMNSVFLWLFGSIVSQHLGKWWALGCFIVCGIGGSAMHAYLNWDSEIPCIGASGSVSGLEGIYLGLILQWTLPWPEAWPLAKPIPPMQLGAFAVMGIAMDLYGIQQQGSRVAFGAHVGGFVTGIIIAGVITHCVPTLKSWQKSKWHG